MGGGRKKHQAKTNPYPKVSVCTPTFNRRPFVDMMIRCFNHQTYPKESIEWLIADDGTDPIGDLVVGHPCVKYTYFPTKRTLGEKRNWLNQQATGDIIVYMDDDDYYPPERIAHAVEMLQNHPKKLIAGCSILHIYYPHLDGVIQSGPYHENHATAATFAFRRSLLSQTRFPKHAAVAEENDFLRNKTIPMIQLDPFKTIFVVAHAHNSCDRIAFLQQPNNPFVKTTSLRPEELLQHDHWMIDFFLRSMHETLRVSYPQGSVEHKPDVVQSMAAIQERRIRHNEYVLLQQSLLAHQNPGSP